MKLNHTFLNDITKNSLYLPCSTPPFTPPHPLPFDVYTLTTEDTTLQDAEYWLRSLDGPTVNSAMHFYSFSTLPSCYQILAALYQCYLRSSGSFSQVCPLQDALGGSVLVLFPRSCLNTLNQQLYQAFCFHHVQLCWSQLEPWYLGQVLSPAIIVLTLTRSWWNP